MSSNEFMLVFAIIQIIPFLGMHIIDIMISKSREESYEFPYGFEIVYPILILTPIFGPIISCIGCVVGLKDLRKAKQSILIK